MKRVLLVAGDLPVVQAVGAALRHAPDLMLVGRRTGQSPIGEVVRALHPDLVIVDDSGGTATAGARLQEAVVAAHRSVRVLVTEHVDRRHVDDALQCGATTVIYKWMPSISLAVLLQEIARGHVVHGGVRDAGPADAPTDCPLTVRELEILRLAAQGMTNGTIARRLWVTEQTVKFHLSNIYKKLRVTNRTEASCYAYAAGIVVAEPLAS